ncbi:MAG: hypothetical protein KDG57_22045, partial [Rhodoferax sp.]|nr:hypothetical protein [Rhodoferax sp.]
MFLRTSPHRLTLTLATLAGAALVAACGKTEEPAPAPVPAATPVAAACGKVTVANMNWQSAEVLAQIDAFILAKGYGCEVELVPGDTMPTLT